MDLSQDEVERYLNVIFSGKHYKYIEDKLFVFKHPSIETKIKSAMVYDSSYQKAINDGMLPISELEKLIIKRGLFTEEDQKVLDGLRSRLEAQEILLAKTTKVKANQDRIKDTIAKLKEQIEESEMKRISKLAMSAESKAEEERALYLCWAGTFVEESGNETLFWPTFEKMLNDRNISFRNEILVAFLKFRAGIETKIIRFIARHSLWRIRYVTSQKVSDPLFGVPASQYTNDMLNLAYWSNFYQNIYEMLPRDRPSDLVIEDDDALDAYMKEYYAERTREDASERSKGKNRGKLSAFDKEEVIVTKSNELYQDIEYDKPREAQKLKDRSDVKKRTRRG